jgi:hypothetical protein
MSEMQGENLRPARRNPRAGFCVPGIPMDDINQRREELFQALNQSIGGDAHSIEVAINNLIDAKLRFPAAASQPSSPRRNGPLG